MQLTEKNIQDLYKFTRKHFVEHYDVQTELVDHLANDIENIWKEAPNLTFEQARDKSFKKFGIFGFMNVYEEKQKQMQKKYLKIMLSFVKDWFKLPKIILTGLMVYIFFLLQKIPYSYYIYITFYMVIFSVELVTMLKRKSRYSKKVKKTGKSWMLEDIIQTQGYGNAFFISYYAFSFTSPKNFEEISFLGSVFSASVLTLTIIIGYITLIVIPKKSEELLEKHYPEYKIA